jgi:hypothetical protein
LSDADGCYFPELDLLANVAESIRGTGEGLGELCRRLEPLSPQARWDALRDFFPELDEFQRTARDFYGWLRDLDPEARLVRTRDR